MKVIILAVLVSIVTSAIVNRLMINTFLKELKDIDDAYREDLTKVVIDIIENKKGAQYLQRLDYYYKQIDANCFPKGVSSQVPMTRTVSVSLSLG